MNQANREETVRITENDLPQEFILKFLGQHEANGLWGIKHTREPVDIMVKHAKTNELSLPIVQVVITKEGIFMSPILSKLENPIEGNHSLTKIAGKRDTEKSCTYPRLQTSDMRTETERTVPSLLKMVKKSSAYCEIKNSDVSNRNPGKVTKSSGKFAFCVNKKHEENKYARPITDLQLLERFSTFDWGKTGIFFFGIDTISYGVQDLIFTRVFSLIVVLDRRTRQITGANTSFMCHAFVCESRSTARRVTYALAAAFQVPRYLPFPRALIHYDESQKLISILSFRLTEGQ